MTQTMTDADRKVQEARKQVGGWLVGPMGAQAYPLIDELIHAVRAAERERAMVERFGAFDVVMREMSRSK